MRGQWRELEGSVNGVGGWRGLQVCCGGGGCLSGIISMGVARWACLSVGFCMGLECGNGGCEWMEGGRAVWVGEYG